MTANRPRRSTIAADDGTALSVREYGPENAEMTVIFVHGYCLESASWDYQRTHLQRAWGDRIRMVFYDQRGHGSSSPAPRSTYTISQLGDDLAAVIRSAAPVGPVVLAGHSMGGMTILAYANRHPDDYSDRVAGVALISTAANGLTTCGIGQILTGLTGALICRAARLDSRSLDLGRWVIRRLLPPLVASACGGHQASPRVALLTNKLISDTATVTIMGFVAALKDYDESAGLSAMAGTPALVMCGAADTVTPASCSEALVSALPRAENRVVSGAGHMLALECPHIVSGALSRLLDRALSEKPTRRPGRRLSRTS